MRIDYNNTGQLEVGSVIYQDNYKYSHTTSFYHYNSDTKYLLKEGGYLCCVAIFKITKLHKS